MRMFGSVLQMAGIAATSYGGFLLVHWLGVVLGGVGMFAIGFQLERDAIPATVGEG